MKLVIIGGVAGGATAAARARRLDEKAQIVIFERGEYVSFANCGLPYYVGQVIKERAELLVSTPETFKGKYNIDVRVQTDVLAIDRQAKRVRVRDLQTGQSFDEPYDKLILSPGAEPLRPPLPGVDLPGVFSLRSIPDSDRIKAVVDAGQAKTAVVIGGGFIGLEMADNLVERGLKVTLVEALDQLMPPLDREMAALAHQNARAKGVDLRLSTKITGFAQAQGGGLTVDTEGGGQITCDMAILSVGVRPENALAKAAGLELGPRGHILVNNALQTNDPDIYAVGDAVQIWDYVTGLPVAIALAGPANRQGRIAADNAMGRLSVYRGSLGTAVVKLFGQTIASTGPSQKFLAQNNVAHLVSYSHSANHATYYPGAETMLVKLIFAPSSGRVLGGQIVGGEGVDKRIDVLATAIRAGMSVFDLEELDLAYAPPFGSARDPINVAGMVAANIMRGDVKAVLPPAVAAMDPERDVLIDLRFKEELDEAATIPGSLHIPLPMLRAALPGLDKSKRYILYCAIGLRGYLGYRIMSQSGFEAVNLGGGYGLYTPWMS
ncbi:FAD-dependent pyridine nucleotide-disulfide oxidoreductase [Desulfarculus baarsii DSM 2075]|uniref:FAD-dependent pyridine nucleotide-disulfide oxidoreductase n=1 Tax=Desulfarculus baarsii (strain ATCC 33931 / DSM 2075 / LMG 7858 / VKM B-1802 / 2st14) TaxID=644282 RepID=E1QDJ9_DESB2|nr:FAD-dependent oxidoreductase [Desulfarculus baarsii]ADK83518.1 FAD-dependent pyridine nucleotide-disulfide oxidoreductase [Desulfarculus baarsii DSM 2075]